MQAQAMLEPATVSGRRQESEADEELLTVLTELLARRSSGWGGRQPRLADGITTMLRRAASRLGLGPAAIAAEVTQQGVPVSPQHITGILNAGRRPSTTLALPLARTLGLDLVQTAALLLSSAHGRGNDVLARRGVA